MDWFRVTLHLAGATGERFQSMEALVDTGASYTWIPRLIPVPGLLTAVA